MKRNSIFVTGIILGLIGAWVVVSSIRPPTPEKHATQEGYCEITYPSDWHSELRRSVIEPSKSGEPPVMKSFNPGDPRAEGSVLNITIDIQDPGRTTLIRLVFVESSETLDLMNLSKIQAEINSNQPDYKLIGLEELSINSQHAVRRIESYRVDTSQGPKNYSLVATYFQATNGMCSILLVDAPWSEMDQQMKVYEEIVSSFQTQQ